MQFKLLFVVLKFFVFQSGLPRKYYLLEEILLPQPP